MFHIGPRLPRKQITGFSFKPIPSDFSLWVLDAPLASYSCGNPGEERRSHLAKVTWFGEDAGLCVAPQHWAPGGHSCFTISDKTAERVSLVHCPTRGQKCGERRLWLWRPRGAGQKQTRRKRAGEWIPSGGSVNTGGCSFSLPGKTLSEWIRRFQLNVKPGTRLKLPFLGVPEWSMLTGVLAKGFHVQMHSGSMG